MDHYFDIRDIFCPHLERFVFLCRMIYQQFVTVRPDEMPGWRLHLTAIFLIKSQFHVLKACFFKVFRSM